jgi:hypothetical protein
MEHDKLNRIQIVSHVYFHAQVERMLERGGGTPTISLLMRLLLRSTKWVCGHVKAGRLLLSMK